MGWIGVDLDGTLAHYDKYVGHTTIGEPIPAMVDRVKKWLEEGKDVRIFTARVDVFASRSYKELIETYVAIANWSRKHIGTSLRVTNVKDIHMEALYDDRAFHVITNTGRIFAPNDNPSDD